MCWDCGCKIYDDDMGSQNTLTTARLEELAKEAGKSFDEYLHTVHEGIHARQEVAGLPPERMEAAAKDMGNTVEEEVQNLHDALHVHGHKQSGE